MNGISSGGKMKKAKIMSLLLVGLLGFLPLSAKAKSTKSANSFGIKDKRDSELLNLSVLDTANNARLKAVIEKMKKGQTVYVACLGGSVTEGVGPANYRDGYAYQFQKKLSAKYADGKSSNIKFDGAGLSGTPSTLGLVRYQKDVVETLGQSPDLLVIEFAVNDGSGREYERAFEALIRDALLQNDDTAIIALYSAATYGNQQSWMKEIASHYGVPSVSTMNVVTRALLDGDFTKEKFYTDTVHPTKEGHALQADILMNLLSLIEKEKADEKNSLPQEWSATPTFSGMTRISGNNEDVKIEEGVFSSTDITGQTTKKNGKTDFPQNWYKKQGSQGTFKMTINCKNLIFVYKENGAWDGLDFGVAEIYVDGQWFDSYDGAPSNGWNNAVARVIIDEDEAKEHTVEVKMQEGDEKKAFTILALAYSK